MFLRITSGKFKNLKLEVPDSARPVMEKVRLALFSILGDQVEDAKCLDLYAGAGSLGLEALSRGAQSCDFVDTSLFAYKCINQNIETIESRYSGENLQAQVFKSDAIKFIGDCAEEYDIIFIDPPYQAASKHIFKITDQVLSPKGEIIYLNDHKNEVLLDLKQINPNLEVFDSRKYGITYIDRIRKSG